jgi:Protein of unknown function (DUF3570)
VAATDAWARAKALLGGLLAGGSAVPAADAAVLPDDRAEALFHVYDGGGVRATGPALLVRKSLADRVSLSGQYYVDAVSNASIDVVTSASPFKETRNQYTLGGQLLVRDAVLSVSYDSSKEPDYVANTFGVDATQDVFGGMTTVSLGFSRARDDVGKKDIGFFDKATHWQYRSGVTQILSPRWLASINFEAVHDEGFLGSPYRTARVFGATVNENVPRTRSSRAVKLRAVGDVGAVGAPRTSVRAEYRHYWDNWDIQAGTLELGGARYVGERWLIDAALRFYSQSKALFYSDNAPEERLYVSRNRQLSTFRTQGVGVKATYTLAGPVATKHNVKLTGGYELKQFRFSDFTDVRTGGTYSYNAHVLQVFVSGNF